MILEQCKDTSSLELWLHNHGDKLTQLHVLSASKPLTELPCPNLADLLLQGRSIMASPDLSAMLAGLPSLRQLTLKQPFMNSQFKDPLPDGMLHQLPALTRLELPGGVSGAVWVEPAHQLQPPGAGRHRMEEFWWCMLHDATAPAASAAAGATGADILGV